MAGTRQLRMDHVHVRSLAVPCRHQNHRCMLTCQIWVKASGYIRKERIGSPGAKSQANEPKERAGERALWALWGPTALEWMPAISIEVRHPLNNQRVRFDTMRRCCMLLLGVDQRRPIVAPTPVMMAHSCCEPATEVPFSRRKCCWYIRAVLPPEMCRCTGKVSRVLLCVKERVLLGRCARFGMYSSMVSVTAMCSLNSLFGNSA